jgi:hypothetical protein
VAAHAVGNYEDAPVRVGVGVKGVFVPFSNPSGISSGRYGEMHLRLGWLME